MSKGSFKYLLVLLLFSIFISGCELKKHEYEEISRFYAEARKEVKIEGGDYRTLNSIKEFTLGVTTILYKCNVCGDLQKIEFLGKQEEQSDKDNIPFSLTCKKREIGDAWEVIKEKSDG